MLTATLPPHFWYFGGHIYPIDTHIYIQKNIHTSVIARARLKNGTYSEMKMKRAQIYARDAHEFPPFRQMPDSKIAALID